jgi:pantetheine-phosphate adenylyltransferase
MRSTAVYPGTFDPLTRGHEDIARRAASIFGRVVIAVAANPNKTPLFSVEERVDLARAVLADLKNVEVTGYTGLTVDLARVHDLAVIVRGLRAVSDFDYEFQMAGMNYRMAPDIETVFLMASETHQFIASRLVKEVAMLGGDITSFVPALTLDRVLKRIRG